MKYLFIFLLIHNLNATQIKDSFNKNKDSNISLKSENSNIELQNIGNNNTNSKLTIKVENKEFAIYDFIKHLQYTYPNLYKNIIIYTDIDLNNINKNNNKYKNYKKFKDILEKLLNNPATSKLLDLEKNLPKILKERDNLKLELKKAKSKYGEDFKKSIAKAEKALNNHKIDEYHNLLKVFRDSKKAIIKEVAESFYLEAKEYYSRFKYQKALYYSKKAMIMIDTNRDYLNFYGRILMTLASYPEALIHYKKILSMNLKEFGEKNKNTATSYNNISMIYKDMGELPKALEYQNKSLKIREEILGDKHPNLAISYNNISLIYQAMGELPKALEYQNKALKIQEKTLGDKHPDLATSYNNISLIYLDNKDILNAKKYIEKAIFIMQYNFPNGHPNLDKSLEIQKYLNTQQN